MRLMLVLLTIVAAPAWCAESVWLYDLNQHRAELDQHSEQVRSIASKIGRAHV